MPDIYAIVSAAFEHVYLRMNTEGTRNVKCIRVPPPLGTGEREKFALHIQTDGSVAIESTHDTGVFLSMDGSEVTAFARAGAGRVNCQTYIGDWERFALVPQRDGTLGIRSLEFAKVHLRVDGSGVTGQPPGGGTVNCQFGMGAWEKFRLVPITG